MADPRIYLDACAFNRPFDNQSEDRVKIEAECVARILGHCTDGGLVLVSADTVVYELSQTPDEDLRSALLQLQSRCHEFIRRDQGVAERARAFEKYSIRGMDALHLACAEKGRVDFFITTDYALTKRARKIGLKFQILDPIQFMLHILENAADTD